MPEEMKDSNNPSEDAAKVLAFLEQATRKQEGDFTRFLYPRGLADEVDLNINLTQHLINQVQKNAFGINAIRYIDYKKPGQPTQASFTLSTKQIQCLQYIAAPNKYPLPLFDETNATPQAFRANFSSKTPQELLELAVNHMNEAMVEDCLKTELLTSAQIEQLSKLAINKNHAPILRLVLEQKPDQPQLLLYAFSVSRLGVLSAFDELSIGMEVVSDPANNEILTRIMKKTDQTLLNDFQGYCTAPAWAYLLKLKDAPAKPAKEKKQEDLEAAYSRLEQMVSQINAKGYPEEGGQPSLALLTKEEAQELQQILSTIKTQSVLAKGQSQGFFKGKKGGGAEVKRKELMIEIRLMVDKNVPIYICYNPISETFHPDQSLDDLQYTLLAREAVYKSFQKSYANGQYPANQKVERQKAVREYNRAVMADVIVRCLALQKQLPETTVFDTKGPAAAEVKQEQGSVLFLPCNMFALPAAILEQFPDSHIALLNPMNEQKIGGGALNGDDAVEEAACRSTGALLLSYLAKTVKEVLQHGGTFYYNHELLAHVPELTQTQALITKGVLLLNDSSLRRDRSCEFTPRAIPIGITFVGGASVDLRISARELGVNDFKSLTEWNAHDIQPKIEAILLGAVAAGVDTFICAALGCGEFKNDPALMGKWFAQKIVEHDIDQKIKRFIFAIPPGHVLQQFKQAFVAEYQQLRSQQAPEVEVQKSLQERENTFLEKLNVHFPGIDLSQGYVGFGAAANVGMALRN